MKAPLLMGTQRDDTSETVVEALSNNGDKVHFLSTGMGYILQTWGLKGNLSRKVAFQLRSNR